ncbi:DUF883 family protein [Tardiphaga alba]|uniref:DUF883 family protein n=1 Tax=Tardiphaga alba TaxID=340268 RepID=A0ABX8AGA8_9BRAD|nr:DUF883 family protein [Tardiphaga alba]QUS41425.1 DUF883 family protein [Tardiphaga alba]
MSDDDALSELKKLTDKATYSRLQKDLNAVKNDVTALTEQITDALNAFTGQATKQARRNFKDARSRADGVMSDLQDRGSAVYDDLRERGSAAYDAAYSMEESLEDAITQRPLASVGLALGLGLLIGMAWRR